MNNINWNDFFNGVSNFIKNQNEEKEILKDLNISIAFKYYLEYVKNNFEEGNYNFCKSHLKTILQYLNANGLINYSQITSIELEKYKSYCLSNGNKASTINKRIQLINRVYNYLNKMNLINLPKITAIKLIEDKPTIKYIQMNDIKKIINYSENYLSLENQIIIKILIATGCRRKDITRIKIKDINFNSNEIYLETSKTHISRTFYLDQQLMNDIKIQAKNKKVYLFESEESKPITSDKISSIFKRLKKVLNIENLSPHKLRHSYATYLIKSNVNVSIVKELLGHQTLEMTMRYVHNDMEELKNNSLKYNPLNQIKKDLSNR